MESLQPRYNPQQKHMAAKNGELEVSVSAYGRVKVRVGDSVAIMPLMVAVAMLSREVREFLTSPDVLPFLYPANDAVGKKEVIAKANARIIHERRQEWVKQVIAAGLLSDEIEAYQLAKIKFPDSQ